MSSVGEIVTTAVTSLCSAGGLGMFVKHWVEGVKSEILALQGTIDAQQKTLEVMERRATEIGKIGEDYKQLTVDLPAHFKRALDATCCAKDVEIVALQQETKALQARLKDPGGMQQTTGGPRFRVSGITPPGPSLNQESLQPEERTTFEQIDTPLIAKKAIE